jgi:hypothetical protein
MHAVLAPVGSEGDVNPFLAIGRALARRGHRVSLIAAEVFRAAAAASGLEFVAIGTADEYWRVTADPDLWHPRRGPRVVFAEIARHLRDSYAALDALYRPGETIVVAHLLAFFARLRRTSSRAHCDGPSRAGCLSIGFRAAGRADLRRHLELAALGEARPVVGRRPIRARSADCAAAERVACGTRSAAGITRPCVLAELAAGDPRPLSRLVR